MPSASGRTKWRKLGPVFRPAGEALWMASHASVPFAVPLEGDRFTVYFSTRDTVGRSHGARLVVDLREPTRVLELGHTPVLAPGARGRFDDSGAMPSWLVEHAGCEYLYYIGWNRGGSVPFRNAIGLALRRQGESEFVRHAPGPILDRSPQDAAFVASSCVRVEEGLWRMWYLAGLDWEPAGSALRHRYNIKYATSADGLHWQRADVVCIDFAGPDEYAISRPCVRRPEGRAYEMWYSYRGPSYRIGYARSRDGVAWTRLDAEAGIDVSSSGWDSEMIEYPFVFEHRGVEYMLYNGNDYGRTGFGLAVRD